MRLDLPSLLTREPRRTRRAKLLPPAGHIHLDALKTILNRHARKLFQIEQNHRSLRTRVERLEAGSGIHTDICGLKRCGYFTDYLEQGPPELSHQQYHADLDRLHSLYDTCKRYQGPGPNPWYHEIYRVERHMRVR